MNARVLWVAVILGLPLQSDDTHEPGSLAGRIQAEALAQAEREARGLPGTYRFRTVGVPALPPLAGPDARVEFSHLSKKEPSGRFFATFRISKDGRQLGFARADLEGSWTGLVLRAKESLPRKSVPDESQVESAALEGTPPPGALTVLPDGHRLRQPVPAGRVLTFADLEPIPLVQAGERIRLTAAQPGVTIVAEATARGTGCLGQRVRVELPGSRKWVHAQVNGQGEAVLEGFSKGK
ncbi:MAG: flagellar basal body P-ring formation protein FlgA [Acidobacteria bacterium]|nr:flagellar basal body P-ring formation protein FlgA [Acidobacteriota bacterium]